jgi:oligopeptide transport system substrate-binding protein
VTRAGEIDAYRFVPPGIADYEQVKRDRADDVRDVELLYNVERARDLMHAAGYRVPGRDNEGRRECPKIELLYNTNEAHQQIAELIQSQWKEALGINVELVNKEWGSYLADQRNLDYSIARAGWIGDYNDPNTFLELFVTDGPQNETGWGDPRYDALIEAAGRGEISAAAAVPGLGAIGAGLARNRMEFLLAAEQIFLQAHPVIPIYYYVSKGMVRPYVSGLYENIQDTHPYKGIKVDKAAKRRLLEEQGLR